MNPAHVIAEVVAAGFRLYLKPDGQLVLNPGDKAPPELLERLRAIKAQLIAYLRTAQQPQPAWQLPPNSERLIRAWLDKIGEPTAEAWIARAQADADVARDLLWMAENQSGVPPWLQ